MAGQIDGLLATVIAVASAGISAVLTHKATKRKQDTDDFEAIKTAYREMVEDLKRQVDLLAPKVTELEMKQYSNMARIQNLELTERNCKEELHRIGEQNKQLLELLKRMEK